MESHKIGIATVSLGWHPSHTLDRKIEAVAKRGFDGVEIYYNDLVAFATAHSITELEASSKIGKLCSYLGVTIICLQPFMDFAGVLTPLATRLETGKNFVAMARAMGTSVIQVPTTFETNSTGDEDVVVRELQALADLGRGGDGLPQVSFAFEALSWGVHHALLDDAVRIVNLVDRPNFGLCLDTYHVLARVWADPRSLTGVAPGGDAALRATLARFKKECPPEKMFFLQLSDAERLDRPLVQGHPGFKEEWAHWDVAMHWCVYGRLFPYETERGAYLQLDEILKLWLKDMGWKGWVSMEIFHRDEEKEEVGPEVLADRAYKSWEKVKKVVGLE